MSVTTEYSRILVKRSTSPGVVPTIPTASTIDNTWVSTDLLVGEIFMNTADDRVWMRTDNGIVEIAVSGSSMYRYTTGATLVDNTIFFDRTDMLSAYSIDLSSISVSGDYLPLSVTGNTTIFYDSNIVTLSGNNQAWQYGGDYSASYTDRSIVDKAYVDSVGGGLFTGGTISGDVTFQGDSIMSELSATSISILNSGSTARQYFDYSSNVVQTGVTNSAIVGGSGNTITSGLRNVFVSGVDLTAYSSDTAYFSNVTLGGSIRNLSQFNVDVNGFEIISVGTGLTTTANVDTYGTIISSRDSRINPGVVNSAVIAATGRTASANNTLYTENLNVNGSLVGAPCDISFAISDETTAITTGATKLTIYAPYAFTITNVYASLSTSGSTSSQFDVNKNGTTIFSTPLTIDANEFHSKDAATPAVITGTTVAQFDRITVDIDTAGTNAAGAKIYILGKRT
jgi:hypothetical protein